MKTVKDRHVSSSGNYPVITIDIYQVNPQRLANHRKVRETVVDNL